MSAGDEPGRALAQALLEAGPTAGAALPPGSDARTLAWALKDLCYEAWTTQPPRAVRAAEVLQALAAAQAGQPAAGEIAALAQWTAGIAGITRGEVTEAVALFDQAAAGLGAAGLPDPAAQTQVPKIMALGMLGRHDEAAACGLAAQRSLRALGNLGAAARVSQNLGSVHLFRDDYAEAASHFREAAVLFARHGEDRLSVFADVGLADALTAQGDFDEALRIYARARMRAGRLGLALQMGLVDESVALLDLARGRYGPALQGMESACRRYQALAMPQYLAVAEKQLADTYLELRLLPEALAMFEAAVTQFHALGLVVEEAWAEAQRGRTLALLGRPGADAALAAAAGLFAGQGNGTGAAAIALARAELALASGDAAAGLDWAAQAQQGYAASDHADGRARADVLSAQGLLAVGRVDEAGVAFAATLARARELQQLTVQVRCLTGQGGVAQSRGDPAAATAAFEAAIELFEDQRRALPGDDLRSAFLTDHIRPYQERLRTAMATEPAAGVLLQLDRFRARALDERLDERGAEGAVPAQADPDTAALRERQNWLAHRVQRLQHEGEDPKALAAALLRSERELIERTRRQRLAAPDLPSTRTGTAISGFSVVALQSALQPGDAVVEYGVLDDELFACVARSDGVTLHRALAAWPDVREAVRAARFQIDTLRHGSAAVRRHMPALLARVQARLQRLHALLWAPLAPQLQDCPRVLVVPHGPLGMVPFAALDGGGGPLGASHQLALAPSARTAWRGLRRPPVAVRQVLALGESASLPHAAHEAAFVAGLFEQGQAFVGAQATRANLQAHACHADILHLACHAQFRSDNPRFSALHLHDGPLAVDAAELLGLRACTVVLSACETGLSEAGVGDESMGLVRGFLVAGAARVVASLWPVDDAVTEAFMSRWYGALAAGHGPAAALQAAQLSTRRQEAHPYFWAAFVLHGGW